MMDNNSGADKLINSILEDAQKEAAAIEAQAEAEVAAIRARLDEGREKLRDEFAERAAKEREDILKRAATNAELDGRKELLSRKRALIDEAYDKAFERLCAFRGEERRAVLKKLIEREASGTEELRPAAADREALSALVAGTGLRLGANAEGISGGFMLVGDNFVKNCSFEALMEDVKSRTLEKAAKILFD